ncbi:MAG: TonB-dependent receptor, partial [Bacteroidales bacterium]
IHTGFERYSFRNSINARLNDRFNIGQSLKAFYTNRHGDLTDNYDEAPISRAFQSQAIIPVYDIMGNFAGSRGLGMGGSQNPVAMLTRAKNNYSKNFRLLGTLFGEANIIEGLTFKSFLGYDFRQVNTKNMRLANPEAAMAETIDRLTQGTNYSFQWNWANTLDYNITLADVHSLQVILGTEAIANTYNYMDAGRSQYFSNDPNYMQLSSGEINQINSGSGSEWSLFSIFGRANYDLLGKYYLEVTLRRDGSSRFGPENRYATFPSVSFAWAISQEDFMAGTRNWIDFLKLRLGWGKSGNDRIGNYNVFTTYSTHDSRAAYALDGSNTSTSVGFQPAAMGNPDVTWETTETYNVGLDFTILNNSLKLSADVWQRNTSDMLYRLSIPQVMGMATAPYVNIGEMKNTGFD